MDERDQIHWWKAQSNDIFTKIVFVTQILKAFRSTRRVFCFWIHTMNSHAQKRGKMACIIAVKAIFLPSIEVLIFQHLPVFFLVMPFTCDTFKWLALHARQAQMFAVIRIDPIQIEKERTGNRNSPWTQKSKQKLDLLCTKSVKTYVTVWCECVRRRKRFDVVIKCKAAWQEGWSICSVEKPRILSSFQLHKFNIYKRNVLYVRVWLKIRCTNIRAVLFRRKNGLVAFCVVLKICNMYGM